MTREELARQMVQEITEDMERDVVGRAWDSSDLTLNVLAVIARRLMSIEETMREVFRRGAGSA